MTDLVPLTALGGTDPRILTVGPLTLGENTGLDLASLSIRADQAWPTPFALTLPDVGKTASNGTVSALWTGPHQWMILGEGKAETDFALELNLEAQDCVVTEQTDGFACFDLTGPAPDLTSLLAKLVNIDPKNLVPGTVVRTGLAHMTVFVVRHSADHLAILGMRSFAGSLWEELETVLRHQASHP